MSDLRLPRDVFVALAAIAQADGHVDEDEADAIVRAAVEAGLSLDEITELETATRDAVDPAALDRLTLSRHERLFVYAVACWIARMDGKVTDAESLALAGLGERLGVPERARTQVEALAREVADLPEGDRPPRYDLAGLHRRIGERLLEVPAARVDP